MQRPILLLKMFILFSFSASKKRCAVDLPSVCTLILIPCHGVKGLSGKRCSERCVE